MLRGLTKVIPKGPHRASRLRGPTKILPKWFNRAGKLRDRSEVLPTELSGASTLKGPSKMTAAIELVIVSQTFGGGLGKPMSVSESFQQRIGLSKICNLFQALG